MTASRRSKRGRRQCASGATEAGLALGSNLGDRAANLKSAAKKLALIPGLKIAARSRIYETEPVGVAARHREKRFLNAALVIRCSLSPAALLRHLLRIERGLGRVRREANEPRPIDIDIIYFGARRLNLKSLTAPHPRWKSRRFVVMPLADIRPDLVLPGESRTVRQVLSSLPARPKVVLFAARWGVNVSETKKSPGQIRSSRRRKRHHRRGREADRRIVQ